MNTLPSLPFLFLLFLYLLFSKDFEIHKNIVWTEVCSLLWTSLPTSLALCHRNKTKSIRKKLFFGDPKSDGKHRCCTTCIIFGTHPLLFRTLEKSLLKMWLLAHVEPIFSFVQRAILTPNVLVLQRGANFRRWVRTNASQKTIRLVHFQFEDDWCLFPWLIDPAFDCPKTLHAFRALKIPHQNNPSPRVKPSTNYASSRRINRKTNYGNYAGGGPRSLFP